MTMRFTSSGLLVTASAMIPTTGCGWRTARPGVTGTVIDAETLAPIAGATIAFEMIEIDQAGPPKRSHFQTKSDQKGHFKVEEKRRLAVNLVPMALSPTSVTLTTTISCPGHEAHTKQRLMFLDKWTDQSQKPATDFGLILMVRASDR